MHINFTLVGLFGFHLLSHVDIYSLYWGIFLWLCFWIVFIIMRISISRYCSIHFTVVLARLKKIISYLPRTSLYRGSLNRVFPTVGPFPWASQGSTRNIPVVLYYAAPENIHASSTKVIGNSKVEWGLKDSYSFKAI